MKNSRTVRKKKLSPPLKKRNPLIDASRLVIIPLLFFLIFIGLYFYQLSLTKKIARYDISSFSDASMLTPYPVLSATYTPTISAQAAVVMDNDSKVFLYTKNPQLRFSMASTTKLMTALVGLEYFALDDILTIQSSGVEGSSAGLQPGERYSFESLLYAMLLPSANDAAFAIADNFPGGRKAFMARMNEKAEELHLSETRYDDPAGLGDDANFTTAVDLARLASAAIDNETIAEITGTKNKVIRNLSGSRVIELENLNKLLGANGVIGIKTGFTQGAGGVLTTAKKENGHILIFVVMRSNDRFADTEQLITMVQGQVTYINPVYAPLGIPGSGLTQ